MEMQETKVKSFRITEETADKFKEIASAIGGNQQETLAKLIETYETQAGKAMFPDIKEDLQQFETYTFALNRMYLASMENLQNAKTLARTEYDAQLRSKDQLIQELQTRIKESEMQTKELQAQAKEQMDLAKEQVAQMQADLEHFQKDATAAQKESTEKIQSLSANLADKDALNHTLSQAFDTQRSQLEDTQAQITSLQQQLSDLVDHNHTLQESTQELSEKIQELSKEKDHLKTQMEQERQSASFALEREKNAFSLELERERIQAERKANESIQALQEQYQKRLDASSSKYMELFEQYQELKANAAKQE